MIHILKLKPKKFEGFFTCNGQTIKRKGKMLICYSNSLSDSFSLIKIIQDKPLFRNVSSILNLCAQFTFLFFQDKEDA